MKIRIAQRNDAPIIASYNIILAEETERLRLDQKTVLAGVEALLSDGSKGFYLVAEEDDAVIGQAMITMEWSDWRNKPIWWVQSVFVQKEWRHKGVFTMLLRTIRQQARTQGVAFLRLYTFQDNVSARHTYEKTGWTQEPYLIYHHPI
ncbi:MAG TPA: GNAT family N-acetyltransferase [Candidatus Thermoplasmatota archaeon]|nr:GNAT family N-acetyltransferase [Candidatus Thermoplasmatota archaeon]